MDGIHGGGSNYADGVTIINNQLQIELPRPPDLYYFCQNRPGMGGSGRADTDDNFVGGSVMLPPLVQAMMHFSCMVAMIQ